MFGIKFLKVGRRHVVVPDPQNPAPVKVSMSKMDARRDRLSKICAMVVACEDATPDQKQYFAKVDVYAWLDKDVNRVWNGLVAMKAKGEFTLTGK